ncbi:MAG: hypothetical protein MJ016_02825 [Victivallaceae bacterium]|nr:hypothetical protein [Victivallaceae bacterium]
MLNQFRYLALFCALFFVFAPQARAIDPITIPILAPLALRGAKMASPYVLRGCSNGIRGGSKIFMDSLHLLRLPWGIFQMMFLWPWGSFHPGLVNVFRGCIAPVKIIIHSLMLPLYMFGVNSNF